MKKKNGNLNGGMEIKKIRFELKAALSLVWICSAGIFSSPQVICQQKTLT